MLQVRILPPHPLRSGEMKYKVTYEYRGSVEVEVEAESEKEADDKGIEEADELIGNHLSIYGATVKQID